jgi:hypothetical protein
MLVRIHPHHEFSPDISPKTGCIELRNFVVIVYTPSPRKYYVSRLLINNTEIDINNLFDSRNIVKVSDIFVEAECVEILHKRINDKPEIIAKITTRQPLALSLND